MTDLEIARSVKGKPILDIAESLGLSEDDLIFYGKDKAKVTHLSDLSKHQGNLILVTAISPTPMGEGKTTVSIGLADALSTLGKKVSLSLREPSLGPVFGMKGGATGGGYSQVIPMEDINLHFTGDFHAITTCNNLISAAIYNHIYQGNSLDIKEVVHHGCLDVNDRSLRKMTVSVRDTSYDTSFCITSASSMMTLFCLANDKEDLRRRLRRMIVAYNGEGKAITVADLKLDGSLMVLLKDAIYPNLVQTLEGTPTFIHGGPFANIAHGCSSVIATKLSLSLSDYTITEAGFGADLGAEKFLNIKCQSAGLSPSLIVLVATVKALKYHGDGNLEKGFSNLEAHIDHLKQYGVPLVVAINQFETDKEEEITSISQFAQEKGCACACSRAYKEGGKGAVSLAKLILQEIEKPKHFVSLYEKESTIVEKLSILGEKVYHATQIKYSNKALQALEKLKNTDFYFYPICVSKTQYSISDDPKKLGYPKNNTLYVKDIHLESGAGFVTFMLGDIYPMPGLPKHPNYEKIDFIDDKIVGLF